MHKVVINTCFGGFGLSTEALDYLEDKFGLQVIRDRFGGRLEVNLERHDPRLVEVVEVLGEKASDSCARLVIEEVISPVYRIEEYDGRESIETPDSLDWITI